MQTGKIAIWLVILLGILISGVALLRYSPVLARTDTCPDSGGWTKIDSDDLSSYPVDGATDYCFKYGSPNSQGCIGGLSRVWPPVIDGKYCGLSHWSYLVPAVATPTPTPTGRPTPTPTRKPNPTPTSPPRQTPTPTQKPTPTPTTTPRVTPTPTSIPQPTPTPTEAPKQESTTSTPTTPVCEDWVPGGVSNIYVDRGVPNDGKLEVRWLSDDPKGNEAHIRYTDRDPGDWRYALLNTPNDGVETISGLENGVHYWFSVAQVNGCAVGSWSASYDPLP